MVFITNKRCEICQKKLAFIWIEAKDGSLIGRWICNECYEEKIKI